MADHLCGRAKRELEMEDCIAKLRAQTVTDLATFVEDFEREKKPWFDTFNMLERINQPNEHTKAEFLRIVEADKKAIQALSDSTMLALDLMEKDIRRARAALEATIEREGEPNEVQVLIEKTFSLQDYFVMPSPPQ